MADQSQFEVLTPWAEVDPIQLKGLMARIPDLTGKTIGLLYNWKMAALPIQRVVEQKLKDKIPALKTTWYYAPERMMDLGGEKGDMGFPGDKIKADFEQWVNGVDTVVAAVGD
jgi:hypothetical protein